MQILSVTPLAIPEVKLVEYKRFQDERGYFTETFRSSDLWSALELPETQVLQINESVSKKHVVRGLHIQYVPPMSKLVRVVQGRMLDLALDVRENSPTFGKIVGAELSATLSPESESSHWIYIPEGFAHAVMFLEDSSIEYLCSAEYAPSGEAGILPTDPAIDWSICNPEVASQAQTILQTAVFSEKDRQNLTLAQFSTISR